jgi:hypothetical protein
MKYIYKLKIKKIIGHLNLFKLKIIELIKYNYFTKKTKPKPNIIVRKPIKFENDDFII